MSKFLLAALFADARRVDVKKFRVERTVILRLRPRKLIFLFFSKIKGFLREQLTSDYLFTSKLFMDSKTVGLIAKLRHFVPQHTLLNIYRALILPYLSYGLIVWGQASKTHLTKNLIASEKSYPFHIFCQQESSCHSSFY